MNEEDEFLKDVVGDNFKKQQYQNKIQQEYNLDDRRIKVCTWMNKHNYGQLCHLNPDGSPNEHTCGPCRQLCNVELYDDNKEKEGMLSKLWNKSIFPDMIKRRKEEKKLRRTAQLEAKTEALGEIKDELKEHYKKEEIDKLTKKKGKDFFKKLAAGFKDSGVGSSDKIGQMLGQGSFGNNMEGMLGDKQPPKERVVYVKTKKGKKKKGKVVRKVLKKTENKIDNFEDKIKNMLS